MGQQFRLSRAGFRKALFEHFGNAQMELLAFFLQQRLIGRVLDQGVLELVAGGRRPAVLKEQFRLHQLRQFLLQRLGAARRRCGQQLVAEFPANRGGQLHDVEVAGHPIQPGCQEVLQSGRNGMHVKGVRHLHFAVHHAQAPASSSMAVNSSTNSGTPSVRSAT